MRTRVIWELLVILCLGVGGAAVVSTPAHATPCSAPPPSIAEALEFSDAVFVGTIIHQEEYDAPNDIRRDLSIFRVHRMIKGKPRELIVAATFNLGASVGDTYLLFARSHGTWDYFIGPCAGSAPVWERIDEHAILGSGVAPNRWEEYRTFPFNIYWAVGGAVTLLSIGFLLAWRWRPNRSQCDS